jgi:hypothetical protein
MCLKSSSTRISNIVTFAGSGVVGVGDIWKTRRSAADREILPTSDRENSPPLIVVSR